MICARFTLRFLLITAATVLCCCLPVHGAPPAFEATLDVPPTRFSSFPTEVPDFIFSLEPNYGYPLDPNRQKKTFEYDFDYEDRTVTITERIKKDLGLVPVTMPISDFRDRRIQYSLNNFSRQSQLASLKREEQKKAGGLFQISIPIRSRTFESIFGEGGAGLKVSGFQKITFAGRSQWSDKTQSALNRQSKFPSLEMEQIYRYDITGTIGSKITVKVSQDSRSDIPLANRLILRYQGEEDEILQAVELGNTTLNLPATQFLQYSTRVQGLFGIKATAQIADVSITAIASQEKGSTETIEIAAGSSAATEKVIQDINYAKRMFYDLGRLPWRTNRPIYDSLFGPPETRPVDFIPRTDQFLGDSILEAIVYIDDEPTRAEDKVGRFPAYCYLDPLDTLADTNLTQFNEFFELIPEEEYYINPSSYYLQFLGSGPQSNHTLGVYMRVLRRRGGASYIDTIGDVSGDTLRLKLIKPKIYTNVPSPNLWEYEWRNVYSLGARNIDIDEVTVTIRRAKLVGNTPQDDHPVEQDGTPYLQIFGLDLQNTNGQPIPDGIIDQTTALIDPVLGLLVFPDRHPFDPAQAFVVDSVTGDSVYPEETVSVLYDDNNFSTITGESKYYMTVSAGSTVGQSQIRLNATNIIEGSEVITHNGKRLQKGADYNIDYDFGTLTLLDDAYTSDISNLSVMFETAPFFSISQKTLLGTRMEYSPNRDFQLGTTLLFKSDKTTNRKPKVGEETSKIFVWDADLSYRFKSDLLTNLVDALPLVRATSDSYVQLSGEVAQSLPEPNVEDQAFIDDFEGSLDSYSLGIQSNVWTKASRPVQLSDRQTERGDFAWYNPYSGQKVRVWTQQEIFNTDINAANTRWTVLDLFYAPVDFQRIKDSTIQGEDTLHFIDTTSVTIPPQNSWNGMMRAFSEGIVTQIENVQLLEMRVRGDVGVLHIDLGEISEDINGDNIANTEDINGNDILDENEDSGVDGVFDDNEYGFDPVTNPDPGGDNWIAKYRGDDISSDYNVEDESTFPWGVNGTEGNLKDGDRIGPDEEDINGYNGVEKGNNYFSYRINLSDTLFEVPGTRDENTGWRTIRVPLRDVTAMDTIIGNPDWANIRFARLWIDSAGNEYTRTFGGALNITIAQMDLVSTAWADSTYLADSLRSNSTFDVAVINNQIDGGYEAPPGVTGFFDQATNIQEKEQSLLLTFKDLSAGILVNDPDSGLILASDTGLAVRTLFRAQNYKGYRKLEMFVHGDENIASQKVLFFLRMGTDKNSYYEYRDTLQPGWLANNVVIDFDEITGLKARLLKDREEGTDSSLIRQEGNYLVKINQRGTDPSLTRIQYFAVGVVNLDPNNPATSDVWVNELRLTDVRDDRGVAARFSVSGNLSDLMTYNGSWSYQDAFYRGVSSATKGGAADNLGSGKTRTNYAFSGTVNLHSLFPRSWEMKLPVSFNWAQSRDEPLLEANSDITVPEEFKDDETTLSINKGFRASISFNKKPNNLLYEVLLSRTAPSFSYNVTESRSPTRPYSFSESYTAQANYNMSLNKPPTIAPLSWLKLLWSPFNLHKTRLYLYPTKLTVSGSFNGSFSNSLNQNGTNPVSLRKDFTGTLNASFKIFDNLSGSYSFTTKRDLSDPETLNLTFFKPREFKLGVENNYNQNFTGAYTPNLFKFLTHKFNYSARYNDNLTINSDSSFYYNAGLRTTAGADFSFLLDKFFGTNNTRRKASRSESGSVFSDAYKTVLTGVRYITDAVKSPNFSITFSEDQTYPALADKASMLFRLGLTDDPGAGEVSGFRGTIRKTRNVNKAFTAGSGLSIFRGVTTDFSYSKSISETFQGTPYRNETEKWPEVRFSFRSVKGLWILGTLINELSPSSSYSRTFESRIQTESDYIQSESERKAFSPLVSISFAPFKSLKTSFRYESSITTTWQYNKSSGGVSKTVKSYSNSIVFGTSYSYRNPLGIKLPLFGRVKFQSTLTMGLDVSYKVTRDEEAGPTTDFAFLERSKRTSLDIHPSLTYSFSSTIKGSLDARWQDTNDLATQTKRHTRELRMSVEMRF